MSSDRPSASRSSADAGRAEPGLASEVRERGAPLLEALEEHLPGSGGHAEATAAHAFAAAVGMGLHRAVAELCREVAKLHDVGMIYVPRTVALTPYEELDAAGRAQFEAHYEAGAKLAVGAGVPEDVCDWLLRIRERFDGAGPEGLAREAIPIASRITRAACACDLVWRPPTADSAAAATARLRAAAGTELDPAAVDALAESLPGEAS